MEQSHKTAIVGLEKSIKSIVAEMIKIIKEDVTVLSTYNLFITLPGIGHLTAIYLICCTNNFSIKRSGKQLACYAGVVQFEHSSDISIRGRNRVHRMANKDLKKLLYMGAISAIHNHREFKNYFDRKKAEGKHSMSILNAIRNKIILRAASVVNNRKPYVNNTRQVDALDAFCIA